MNPTNHNWIEGDYVLVTGKHGSRALFSVGELDTKFAPAGAVTLTLDWQVGMTWPARAERSKTCPTSMSSMPSLSKRRRNGPFLLEPMLVVSGEGIIPKTYDLADLEDMAQEPSILL